MAKCPNRAHMKVSDIPKIQRLFLKYKELKLYLDAVEKANSVDDPSVDLELHDIRKASDFIPSMRLRELILPDLKELVEQARQVLLETGVDVDDDSMSPYFRFLNG